MAQAYAAEGMSGRAVFELFFRRLPESRNYVLAAGLSEVLEFLERFHFEPDELAYLRSLGLFSNEFLERLSAVRFTGDVYAVLEGTLVFPNEPLLQVIAPILEAQLVETFVLNQVHLQSVIASKAARVIAAAEGRVVVDFGSRRAHGTDAALKVARASYLAGAAGTSNLLAGRRYGIPVFGTMAHSFVQSFETELAAFEAFARLYPATTLLVDTYDTLAGTDHVIQLAQRLGQRFQVRAVRLDSGDLDALSKAVRAKLDAAGLQRVKLFASSGLDEHAIASLLANQSPIDGFGVGTELALAADAPGLDMAYKLVEYDGVARTKLSSGKVIYPGRKQVFRQLAGGTFTGDIIGGFGEDLPGSSLLVPVMRGGRRLPNDDLGLDAARHRARAQLGALPAKQQALAPAASAYPVRVSEQLALELDRLSAALGPRPQGERELAMERRD